MLSDLKRQHEGDGTIHAWDKSFYERRHMEATNTQQLGRVSCPGSVASSVAYGCTCLGAHKIVLCGNIGLVNVNHRA